VSYYDPLVMIIKFIGKESKKERQEKRGVNKLVVYSEWEKKKSVFSVFFALFFKDSSVV